MATSRPFWLFAAPAVFLILWSAGFAVAKIAVLHAAPLTVLALRYAILVAVISSLAVILRPR